MNHILGNIIFRCQESCKIKSKKSGRILAFIEEFWYRKVNVTRKQDEIPIKRMYLDNKYWLYVSTGSTLYWYVVVYWPFDNMKTIFLFSFVYQGIFYSMDVLYSSAHWFVFGLDRFFTRFWKRWLEFVKNKERNRKEKDKKMSIRSENISNGAKCIFLVLKYYWW